MGTGYTRGIEVQVLVNLTTRTRRADTATSHGDLFSIWGAKCKPDRPHPTGLRTLPAEREPLQGRRRVEPLQGHRPTTASSSSHVNGKEVSGVSECNPRKGYLALESEGSECRFKNLKIKELPSTNPKPERNVRRGQGLQVPVHGARPDGLESPVSNERWRPPVSARTVRSALWSEQSFGDFEMVIDYNPGTTLYLRGSTIELPPAAKGWSRAILRVKGNDATLTTDDKSTTNFRLKAGPKTGPIGLANSGAGQFRNLFVRALKADE